MSDIKWIKVYTNMVSNKKIKRIRTLPEGNNIVLIWVFLIAQAGESNKGGALYLTDTIPFRPEDLAVEFDFEISVINLALITLQKFSMIEVSEEIVYIKNWEEYQNIEGLEKIREQTRIRVSSHREKQKQLAEGNATCNVTVTQGNVTELELELDKEINKPSRAKKFADDDIKVILAQELSSYMKRNNPECGEHNLQSWALDFDRMIRLDERTVERIREIMKFSQDDEFWKGNILSASKLRKQFNALIIKSKSSSNGRNKYNQGVSAQEMLKKQIEQRQSGKGLLI